MRTFAALIAMGLSAALIPACGSSQKSPPSAEATQASNTVPAGTRVRVRLNTALGTDESTPGQYFTATVVTPLANAKGQTVVPAGALVTGRVVAVDRGSAASVQILFTSIDGGQGPAPIAATVRNPAGTSTTYSTAEVYSQGLPYSAVLLPPRAASPLGIEESSSSVGGGPRRSGPPPDLHASPSAPGPGGSSAPAPEQATAPQASPDAGSTKELSVNLPVGAALELVLTQPLLYPAAPTG